MAITSAKTGSSFTSLIKYDTFLGPNSPYIPSSFESIASVTGTGSSGTITFSSIPSTYKHLQIRGIARSTQAVDNDINIIVQFNSDTSTNYTRHALTGDGTTAGTNSGTSQTSIYIYSGGRGNSSSTDTLGAFIADIHDYASTTKNKTLRSFSGADDNDTTGDIALSSGLWMSTSAITSIEIKTTSGSWTTQTQFALYGIKGA